MSRIRNVKPEFFLHDDLMRLEEEHPAQRVMLVYIGLWTLCDKNGNFDARPRHIKLSLLPFVKFDIAKTLDILEAGGYLRRYEVDGKPYGTIPTFGKHQLLSGKEAHGAAKYPGPPESSIEHDEEPIRDGSGTVPDMSRDNVSTVPDRQDIGHKDIGHKDTRIFARDETKGDDPETGKPFSYSTPIPVPQTTTGPPDSQWIATEFFRRWSGKTARLVGPQTRDYQAAHELLASLGGTLTPQLREEVGAAIARYLERWQDYWFARKGSPPAPDWSFRGFARHYAELAEAEQAQQVDLLASPEIQARLKKIKEASGGR